MTVELHELGAKMAEVAENAAGGEDVILLREGKPFVKVTQMDEEASFGREPVKRIGFLEGEWKMPADFDAAFADEIQSLFQGGSGK